MLRFFLFLACNATRSSPFGFMGRRNISLGKNSEVSASYLSDFRFFSEQIEVILCI